MKNIKLSLRIYYLRNKVQEEKVNKIMQKYASEMIKEIVHENGGATVSYDIFEFFENQESED